MGKHQGHCAVDGFSILLSLLWAGVYCTLTVFQALGSIQEGCLRGLHHNLPWPTPWDLAQGLTMYRYKVNKPIIKDGAT